MIFTHTHTHTYIYIYTPLHMSRIQHTVKPHVCNNKSLLSKKSYLLNEPHTLSVTPNYLRSYPCYHSFLFSLFVHRPNFSDHNRLTTLIRMSASDMAASLAGSGHRYAMTHSASTLTPLAKWNEVLSGVTQVCKIQFYKIRVHRSTQRRWLPSLWSRDQCGV